MSPSESKIIKSLVLDVLLKEEKVNSNLYSNGQIIQFPELKSSNPDGVWYAERTSLGATKYYHRRSEGWSIYDANNWKGSITDNGDFTYLNLDASVTFDNRPDFIDNPEQVARFIYLQTQKRGNKKQLTETNVYGSPEELSFPELDGMFMVKTTKAGYTFWTFYNNEKKWNKIGLLIYNPSLKLINASYVWTLKVEQRGLFDEEEDASRFVDEHHNINFKQLAKYIWLKNQKPLNEGTNIKVSPKIVYPEHTKIDIPEFPGWYVEYRLSPKRWFIYSPPKDKKLRHHHVASMYDNGYLHWIQKGTGRTITEFRKEFKSNLLNAVRYVWLQRQEALK